MFVVAGQRSLGDVQEDSDAVVVVEEATVDELECTEVDDKAKTLRGKHQSDVGWDAARLVAAAVVAKAARKG